MLKDFINQLEQRPPIASLLGQYHSLFEKDNNGSVIFSVEAFSALLNFLVKGPASLQHIAAQAGAKWSSSSQKIVLRNAIYHRGFVTPACLWAYRRIRGNPEVLFNEFSSPEMNLMQIILLKDVEATKSVPFLIQRFLNRSEVPQELKAASKQCLLNILHGRITPDQVRQLCSRYPGLEEFCQWRQGITKKGYRGFGDEDSQAMDFHQLVRSVRTVEELSSLTRTVYLVSQFYVPLSTKDWRSILLSSSDRMYFTRLIPTGLIEPVDDGYILSNHPAKRGLARKFLYESYGMARDSIVRTQAARIKEEHRKRVRRSELDRQALEMLPDGVICVDKSGLLYYMNPAAERLLLEYSFLKENLFGDGPLEEAVRRYSKDRVMAQLNVRIRQNGDNIQVFGDRVIVKNGVKRFDVALGSQVILIRNTTDQYLIDREIGKLYRHELKAALDVMAFGLETSRELFQTGKIQEGLDFLEQVGNKRSELCSMLEERIDFIRLHSDAFAIRPQDVNLNLVVEKCVSNYRDSALAKRVNILSNHLDHEPVHVHGEERFLIRALDNVVRNAVKFCYPDTEIKITLENNTKESIIQVEDVGPGIVPEHLHKIFQLGFTTGGSGRGLYMARRIATAHGGRIEVASEVNKGSLFTLRLPIEQG